MSTPRKKLKPSASRRLVAPPEVARLLAPVRLAVTPLSLPTAVRRHVFSHNDNQALACLYFVSRAARQAVVDHCRNTSRVDLWTDGPPQRVDMTPTGFDVEWADSQSAPGIQRSEESLIECWAYSLAHRYPSQAARLAVVALDRKLSGVLHKSIGGPGVGPFRYLYFGTRHLRVHSIEIEAHVHLFK